MLLEFRTSNYKSLSEEVIFSMQCAPKQSGLSYSIFQKKQGAKTHKIVCSSVIYGPNASGKTNVLGAMDTFRAIVLRGNIKNSSESASPNMAAYNLELIPNNKLQENKPVSFSIYFYEQNYFIRYSLSMDIGRFLDGNYSRQIVSEELEINGETEFKREGNVLTFGQFKSIKTLWNISMNNDIANILPVGLESDELFLTNGFKLLVSQAFVKLILNWFESKFMVIYQSNSMQLIRRFSDPKKGAIYVEKTIDEAAKIFGITSNSLGYRIIDENSEAQLTSIIRSQFDDKIASISADIFESYGTLRFVNIFPLVIQAIMTGATLVIDEFDASIHPMALMSIINIFHNDEINKNHAQLIFNTHNPIFLNSNLFRRDEIKFVEFDDNTNSSTIYSLADFGTTGKVSVRKEGDYMGNYFINRYGAIKNIDFTPIFEEINKLMADGGNND